MLIRHRNPDLLTLIGEDVPLKRVSGTRGGEYAGPCPFCREGKDRLHVQPAQNLWYCHTCAREGRMEKWEDDISYVRRRNGLSFAEACRLLEITFSGDDERTWSYSPAAYYFPDTRPTPPSDLWQEAVEEEIQKAHQFLFSESSVKTREWLAKERGLTEDTLRKYTIGRIPEDYRVQRQSVLEDGTQVTIPLSFHRGLAIPLVGLDGALWGVKIKRPLNDPSGAKYTSVNGSQAALVGIPTGKRRIVLTEGELDMILLAQEFGEETDCATYGSAGTSNLHDYWFTFLRQYDQVFIMYDFDSAGRQGSSHLAERLEDLFSLTKTEVIETDIDEAWFSKWSYRGLWREPKQPKDLTEMMQLHMLTSYVRFWFDRHPLAPKEEQEMPKSPMVSDFQYNIELLQWAFQQGLAKDIPLPVSILSRTAGLPGDVVESLLPLLEMEGKVVETPHPATGEPLYSLVAGPLFDQMVEELHAVGIAVNPQTRKK